MKQTKVITEGAILLAIFMVLMLIWMYVPGLGIITVVLLSTPFILFTVRHGLRMAIFFLFLSSLLSLLIATVMAVPAAFMFGTSGIVMGEVIRRGKSRYQILLAGTLAFLVNIIIQYVAAVVFFHYNFIEEISKLMNESMKMASTMLEGMGQDNNKEIMEQFEQGMKMFQYLLPSTFVLVAFLFSFMTQMVSTPLLNRFQVRLEAWPPFRNIVLPKSILWYYLLISILVLFKWDEGTFLYTAIINLYFILQWIMTIQGLSFVFFVCNWKGYAKGIPIFITIISFLMPLILSIVRLLGIIDLGFDLRKRLTARK